MLLFDDGVIFKAVLINAAPWRRDPPS
jgi:hypothetical protein